MNDNSMRQCLHRILPVVALLSLFLAGACAAEDSEAPPVPDPYGLGERLALIDHLKEQYDIHPEPGQDVETLRARYHEAWLETQADSDPEAARRRDRARRIRYQLAHDYGVQAPDDADYDELIELLRRTQKHHRQVGAVGAADAREGSTAAEPAADTPPAGDRRESAADGEPGANASEESDAGAGDDGPRRIYRALTRDFEALASYGSQQQRADYYRQVANDYDRFVDLVALAVAADGGEDGAQVAQHWRQIMAAMPPLVAAKVDARGFSDEQRARQAELKKAIGVRRDACLHLSMGPIRGICDLDEHPFRAAHHAFDLIQYTRILRIYEQRIANMNDEQSAQNHQKLWMQDLERLERSRRKLRAEVEKVFGDWAER